MKLSGEQVQAVQWAAFKGTPKPTRRALEQVVELGLAKAPVPGRDPHYRITPDGAVELRARNLTRDQVGKRPGLTRRRVAA